MSQKPPVIPSAQKIGVDVPWVSSWSQESQGGVGPCPTVDGAMAALQVWKPGVGEVVRVIPNHVCVVVHLNDAMHGARGDRIEKSWPVDARGRGATPTAG